MLKIEMIAPNANTRAGQLCPVTSWRIWASPASWPSNLVQDCAPMPATATPMYSRVTTTSEMMIASGRVRRGFLTSSPAVETASRPMNEKKMLDAATWTPEMPSGMNGVRLPERKPVRPTATKSTRMQILMPTMAALTFTDSLTPRTSRKQTSATRMTAGRLKYPPASPPGAADSAAGSFTPRARSRNLLRYSAQLTAMAEAETPYSISRQIPTPNATPSPRVAYA